MKLGWSAECLGGGGLQPAKRHNEAMLKVFEEWHDFVENPTMYERLRREANLHILHLLPVLQQAVHVCMWTRTRTNLEWMVLAGFVLLNERTISQVQLTQGTAATVACGDKRMLNLMEQGLTFGVKYDARVGTDVRAVFCFVPSVNREVFSSMQTKRTMAGEIRQEKEVA